MCFMEQGDHASKVQSGPLLDDAEIFVEKMALAFHEVMKSTNLLDLNI